jgi:hypothetical protein
VGFIAYIIAPNYYTPAASYCEGPSPIFSYVYQYMIHFYANSRYSYVELSSLSLLLDSTSTTFLSFHPSCIFPFFPHSPSFISNNDTSPIFSPSYYLSHSAFLYQHFIYLFIFFDHIPLLYPKFYPYLIVQIPPSFSQISYYLYLLVDTSLHPLLGFIHLQGVHMKPPPLTNQSKWNLRLIETRGLRHFVEQLKSLFSFFPSVL